MAQSPPQLDTNVLFYGDCLEVMNDWPLGFVDLIYLDPPFNSNVNYNILFRPPTDRQRRRSSSNGVQFAQVRAFEDTWTWDAAAAARVRDLVRATAHPAHHAIVGLRNMLGECGTLAYLSYMAERLGLMRPLLKPTGTIYLHCDPTASHYLKGLMDCIFGGANFIDEIIWNYGTPSGGRVAGRKPVKAHETLLVYALAHGKHTYNRTYTPYSEDYVRDWFRHTDEDGRKYQTRSRGGKIVRQYLDESPGVPLSNVWSDIKQLYSASGWFPRKDDERLGYPTQKPLALLERIIKISSNEGDVILDPFCGCGTTIAAAHNLGRQWLGIDISPFAVDLICNRRFEGMEIDTRGIPVDMEGAEKLAQDRPLDFEAWAVTRVPGLIPNERRTGDRGIDGRGKLLNTPEGFDTNDVLAQVKGGSFQLGQVRDFLHTMERDKAVAGVFITLHPVTSTAAHAEAANLGTFQLGATVYPRVQLWSIQDYLERKPLALPPLADPYTGQALQSGLGMNLSG